MKLELYRSRGSIKSLETSLLRSGVQKPFVVARHGSYTSSGAKEATQVLLGKLNSVQFAAFQSNPTLEDAIVGASLFRQNSCDAVIAIGGGSAMDTAKAILCLVNASGAELEVATGLKEPKVLEVPFFCVPTTAGTGSEATHFAVIYVDGKKYSMANQKLLPGFVFLDGALTDSLPPYQKAVTGLDALCQALESIWAVKATQESSEYAVESAKITLANLQPSVSRASKTSNDSMLYAAHLAGRAINISKTTAPHALSYGITKKFGVPHGYAVALTLGHFFEFHETIGTQHTQFNAPPDMFEKATLTIFNLLGARNSSDAKTKWFDFMSMLGLKTKLSDFGVTRQDWRELVDDINEERALNHPLAITLEFRNLIDSLEL